MPDKEKYHGKSNFDSRPVHWSWFVQKRRESPGGVRIHPGSDLQSRGVLHFPLLQHPDSMRGFHAYRPPAPNIFDSEWENTALQDGVAAADKPKSDVKKVEKPEEPSVLNDF